VEKETIQYQQQQPKLGLQGSVVAWNDPWAGEASDRLMRTGTGAVIKSQDEAPRRDEFTKVMKEMGAEFYVHHAFTGMEGYKELLEDMEEANMELCLGNEYGNINGPWTEGTNRYDIPDEAVREALQSGKLIGLLYDEPEHLQINAGQYRKDGWYPHWSNTEGLEQEEAGQAVVNAIESQVRHVDGVVAKHGQGAKAQTQVPLVAEQVFPTMFHLHARAGMAVCPKVMKESFQSLQLATALGAAKQYDRAMWICADLWGPDIGPWFTRTPGFPGHSPEEYASALRLAYWMGPTHLFTENVDVLLRYSKGGFRRTEFGEVWQQFAREFMPANQLLWTHNQALADIALICADDGNYGQHARLLGNRTQAVPEETQSLFHAWHLLSRGTIPAHGSCMHIPGFDFPRHRLKAEVPPAAFPLEKGAPELGQSSMHPLYYPTRSVLVFDEQVREEQLGSPELIIVAGSRLSPHTLKAVRSKAEEGATVIIGKWLVPAEWRLVCRLGRGSWIPVEHLLDEAAKSAAAPFLQAEDCWTQRFGDHELRIYKKNESGTELEFEAVYR
jgi:hypothetical protein